MKRVSLLAGLGGVAFTVLFVLATVISNPLGGSYKASDVADYVAKGHRPSVIVALYLGLFGVVGLLLFLARFRSFVDGPLGTLYWATSVGAATIMLTGWAIVGSVSLAIAYGGTQVTPSPQLSYVFSEVGWVVLYGAGGTLLGVALLTLSLASKGLTSWVRWSALVAALCALAAPAWFPFFVVLLWLLVVGIWLLVTDHAAEQTAAPQPA